MGGCAVRAATAAHARLADLFGLSSAAECGGWSRRAGASGEAFAR
jgi:hypothetical protein